MPFVIARRKLEPGDFDAWKERFEAGAETRRAVGCRGVRRFVNVNDPEEIVVIFDVDSHENARKLVEAKAEENPKLREQRTDGGGPKLDIVYVEELEALPS
jgi:Antibiotic biosynthesis monooxygenase